MQEAVHVRREPRVIAGDPDVLVPACSRRPRAPRTSARTWVRSRCAVVGDGDLDAGLLREPQAHRLVARGVVAQGQQLVAADLRERRARVLERRDPRTSPSVGQAGSVSGAYGDRQPREVPGGEQDDRREAAVGPCFAGDGPLRAIALPGRMPSSRQVIAPPTRKRRRMDVPSMGMARLLLSPGPVESRPVTRPSPTGPGQRGRRAVRCDVHASAVDLMDDCPVSLTLDRWAGPS